MRRVAGLKTCTFVVGVSILVVLAVIVGVLLTVAPSAAGAHSSSGVSTPSPSSGAAASPTPANQGQGTTSISFFVIYSPVQAGPGEGATFPTNLTFSANVTYGVISDTTTWVTVVVNGTVNTLTYNASGGIDTSNVASNVVNGVPYENYTWALQLDATTLGCSDASCSSLITDFQNYVTITVTVTEAGKSGGGGWDSNSLAWVGLMDSTYVTGVFSSPSPFVAATPVNISVAWNLNSSYLTVSNASLDLTLLAAYSPETSVGTAFEANLTLNGTLNVSNAWGGSSSIVSGGLAAEGYWSDVTYTAVLGPTALGFASWADLVAALGDGGTLVLELWATADGTSAGGVSTGIILVGATQFTTGTTFINGADVDYPSAYQPLPFTEYGYANVSWTNPLFATTGNASIGGYVQVYDLDLGTPLIATISLNDSVNTTNADGASLIPTDSGIVASTGEGFVNYTWSFTLTTGMLAGTAYGDAIYVQLTAYVVGSTNVGSLNNTELIVDVPVIEPNTFAQHPTVVSAAFTTPVSGYIDVSTTPYDLDFTLSVTNGTINNATTSISIAVVDATIPAPIYVYTVALYPGQTSYAFPISAATVSTCNPALPYPGTGVDGVPFVSVCPYTSPTDDFYFTLTVAVNGIGAPLNGTLAADTVSIGPAFFIAQDATISILSPAGQTPSLLTGNVTFATFYQGDYISGANLTVYLGTVPVFTAVMTQLEAGVPATSVWDATAAGSYSVVVAMSRTSGGPVYANITLTIASSASTTVYINSSTYHNVTLLGSLSPAVAGTILLLVGLIVGMIVALLVGRMMWGGSKQQEPPQQWQQGQPGAPGSTDSSASGTADSGSTPPPSGGT